MSTSQHGDHPRRHLQQTPGDDLQDTAAQELVHARAYADGVVTGSALQTSRLYNHPRHPAWLRCWLYAMDHDGQDLDPGELRDATGLDPRTLSRGLHQARTMRLIGNDSNARRLDVIHVPLTWQVPHAS